MEKPCLKKADAAYHEKPSVTLERLARLESVMMDEIGKLKKTLKLELMHKRISENS